MQAATFSSDSLRSHFLIDTDELASMIEKKHETLRILNATWYMPNDPRNAKQEHTEARITQDTQYFDIDAITLPGSNLPHTMPGLDVWNEHMMRMRLLPTDSIVCYDTQGMFSVARAAWMFRFFGAHNVRILNGGLKKWNAEGRPLVGGDQL